MMSFCSIHHFLKTKSINLASKTHVEYRRLITVATVSRRCKTAGFQLRVPIYSM